MNKLKKKLLSMSIISLFNIFHINTFSFSCSIQEILINTDNELVNDYQNDLQDIYNKYKNSEIEIRENFYKTIELVKKLTNESNKENSDCLIKSLIDDYNQKIYKSYKNSIDFRKSIDNPNTGYSKDLIESLNHEKYINQDIKEKIIKYMNESNIYINKKAKDNENKKLLVGNKEIQPLINKYSKIKLIPKEFLNSNYVLNNPILYSLGNEIFVGLAYPIFVQWLDKLNGKITVQRKNNLLIISQVFLDEMTNQIYKIDYGINIKSLGKGFDNRYQLIVSRILINGEDISNERNLRLDIPLYK